MNIQHLEDGDLQALLDGELQRDEAASALEHVDRCQNCAERYEDLREASATLTSALAILDVTRTGPPRNLAAPPSTAIRRPKWGGVALAKAAALLLTVGAAASATIPGSPFLAWVAGRFDQSPPPLALEEATVAEPKATTLAVAAVPSEIGVGVEPEAGQVRFVLTRPAPGLPVHAMITNGATGGTYLVGDSASARFERSPGKVEVFDATNGVLRIEIPQSAMTATVEVEGQVYVVRQGDQLRASVSQNRIVGAEVEFQIPR